MSQHRLTTPLEGVPASIWDPLAPIAAPLQLCNPLVSADWVDYNGHMSESCFLLVFGDNSDAFFRFIGIDEAYRNDLKMSLYTFQTMIFNIKEAAEGEPLKLTLQLLDTDAKRVHIFHSMYHGTTGDLLATGEQMLMHVDMEKGKSCPMPQELQDKLQAILKAHSHLPKPIQSGQSISIRRK